MKNTINCCKEELKYATLMEKELKDLCNFYLAKGNIRLAENNYSLFIEYRNRREELLKKIKDLEKSLVA